MGGFRSGSGQMQCPVSGPHECGVHGVKTTMERKTGFVKPVKLS